MMTHRRLCVVNLMDIGGLVDVDAGGYLQGVTEDFGLLAAHFGVVGVADECVLRERGQEALHVARRVAVEEVEYHLHRSC